MTEDAAKGSMDAQAHIAGSLSAQAASTHLLLLLLMQVLPIDACWLQDSAANEILDAVKSGIAEAQLQP